MNEKIYQLLLQNELKSLLQNHHNIVTPEMEIEIVHLMKNLKVLSHIEQKTYSLFDLNKGCYIFHQSPEKEGEKLSVSPIINDENSCFFTDDTHDVDSVFLLKLHIAAFKFIEFLTPKLQRDFELVCQRRIMKKNSDYDCEIRSLSIFNYDASGKPWIIMIISIPCTLVKALDENRYRIFTVKPNIKNSKFSMYWSEKIIKLTTKEKEVMMLVEEGLKKPVIADKMFISLPTVKKHCMNVHSKLLVNSINVASNYSKLLHLR